MSVINHQDLVQAGQESDYRVGDRRIITAGEREIGVFRIENGFVAYENVCLHQGGPVCSGRLFPRLRGEVGTAGERLMEVYDESEPHLVCPWHGWEYDLRTGEAQGGFSPPVSLKTFPVSVHEGQVLVDVG